LLIPHIYTNPVLTVYAILVSSFLQATETKTPRPIFPALFEKWLKQSKPQRENGHVNRS
jgi:hypothetical protein